MLSPPSEQLLDEKTKPFLGWLACFIHALCVATGCTQHPPIEPIEFPHRATANSAERAPAVQADPLPGGGDPSVTDPPETEDAGAPSRDAKRTLSPDVGCEATMSEEAAQQIARASLETLAQLIQNPRLGQVQPTSGEEGCGYAFEVWGVEAWRGAVWNEAYPPDTGASLAELVVSDDRTVRWRQDDTVIPMEDVRPRLRAAARALDRVRSLAEVRKLCTQKIPCDLTVSGLFVSDCSFAEGDRSKCAWRVEVSRVHTRLQRYATFYVRDDGTVFVRPALHEQEAPLTLEEWRQED